MNQLSENDRGASHQLSDQDSLLRLAALAEEFGAEHIASTARNVAERVSEGRFYVACVGQFKRGKSTLINALLEHAILPVGVIPVTAIPTVIRYGKHLAARVCIQGGEWLDIPIGSVEEYVTEGKNPENSKRVEAVEVFAPSTLLETGMCLVDTPGLGSVHSGNSGATREFVPHIDAAIVVIGADPPLSGDELELVETVSQEIQNIVFVLNKSDRTSDSDRSSSVAFTRRVVEARLKRKIPAVFEVSALERMERRGEARDWPKFLEALEQLMRGSGRLLVHQSATRALRRAGKELLVVIEEERAALERPIEESEQRIRGLRIVSERAEHSLYELSHLFTAEQQRLSNSFEYRRNTFLTNVETAAQKELESRLKSLPQSSGPVFRRNAMHIAQEIARLSITPWLGEEEKYAEEGYTHIAKRFIDLANGFFEKIREARVPSLDTIPDNLESEQRFRTRSRFYFHNLERLAAPASPFRFAMDFILGLCRMQSSIFADVQGFMKHLLETNSMRVQNDMDERVTESRRRLEMEIRRALGNISGVADRALDRARRVQVAGAIAVEAARAQLESATREVSELMDC